MSSVQPSSLTHPANVGLFGQADVDHVSSAVADQRTCGVGESVSSLIPVHDRRVSSSDDAPRPDVVAVVLDRPDVDHLAFGRRVDDLAVADGRHGAHSAALPRFCASAAVRNAAEAFETAPRNCANERVLSVASTSIADICWRNSVCESLVRIADNRVNLALRKDVAAE